VSSVSPRDLAKRSRRTPEGRWLQVGERALLGIGELRRHHSNMRRFTNGCESAVGTSSGIEQGLRASAKVGIASGFS